jgi:hypothetical protein
MRGLTAKMPRLFEFRTPKALVEVRDVDSEEDLDLHIISDYLKENPGTWLTAEVAAEHVEETTDEVTEFLNGLVNSGGLKKRDGEEGTEYSAAEESAEEAYQPNEDPRSMTDAQLITLYRDLAPQSRFYPGRDKAGHKNAAKMRDQAARILKQRKVPLDAKNDEFDPAKGYYVMGPTEGTKDAASTGERAMARWGERIKDAIDDFRSVGDTKEAHAAQAAWKKWDVKELVRLQVLSKRAGEDLQRDLDNQEEDLQAEDLSLSPADKKVIDAFTDKQSADSKKLTSDGTTLDGNWMGGSKLAYWKGDKIHVGEGRPHVRSDQTVLAYLRKMTPKNDMAEARKPESMKDVWAILKKEFPGWEEGDMKDAVGSVSPRMSGGAQKLQARFQALKKQIEDIDEVSPPGWKASVKAMKRHPEIDNPYALAWAMKNKGAEPHYKMKGGKPVKKEDVEFSYVRRTIRPDLQVELFGFGKPKKPKKPMPTSAQRQKTKGDDYAARFAARMKRIDRMPPVH